jgi:2-dehydro-3-deoxyphosphooctonate aldolase (KDO 8-P synthase)
MIRKLAGSKFVFIAGPCVIEDRTTTFNIAATLKEIAAPLGVHFIFKASFDKANRTSLGSFRGPGLAKGINILRDIKKKLRVPVLSDVHTPEQVKYVKVPFY